MRDPFWVNFCARHKDHTRCCSFVRGRPGVPSTILLKNSSFPLNCLGTLVQNRLTTNVRICFWTPNSIPFALFVCSDASTTISITLVVKSGLYFFLPRLFWLVLNLHINFTMSQFLQKKKKIFRDCDKDGLEHVDYLGGVTVLGTMKSNPSTRGSFLLV